MRLKIFVLTILLCVFNICFVCAQSSITAEIDSQKNKLVISGSVLCGEDNEIALIVFAPFESFDNLISGMAQNGGKMIFYTDGTISENGNFNFEIPVPNSLGEYEIKVSSSVENISMIYSNLSDEECAKLTTTYYTPWMANYHLTSTTQLSNGYKGGEAGQMLWSLAASPFDENLLILGTDTSGIYRSEDGGESWYASNSGFDVMGTVECTFDPNNEDVVYCLASAHKEVGSANPGRGGMYKSKDGGISWECKYSVPYFREKSDLITFGDNGEVYIGTHCNGILVSTDTGETWNLVEGFDISDDFVKNVVYNEGELIVSTSKRGVFVLDIQSSVWNTRNSGIEENNGEICANSIAVNPLDSNNWFCASNNKLYVSYNRGESWSINRTITDYDIAPYASSDGIFSRVFFSNLKDNTLRLYVQLSVVSNNLRYSDDLGQTYLKPEINKENAFIQDNYGYGAEPWIVSKKNPDLLLVSLDGEVYKSTDGGTTYFASSSGFSGMRAQNFWFNPDPEKYDDIIFGTVDRGAIRTVSGKNMGIYPCVDYSPMEDDTGIRNDTAGKTIRGVAVDPRNTERLYIAIGGWTTTNLKYSLDGGKSFANVGNLKVTSGNLGFVIGNDNNPVIYAGNYISYDDGVTWLSSDYPVMAWSKTNPEIVYGYFLYNENKVGLSRSSDYGKSWEICTLYDITGYQKFTVDANNPNVVYIGNYTDGYSRYTWNSKDDVIKDDFSSKTNAFSSFVSDKIPTIPIYSIAQNPNNSNHMVAGGANNIYYGNSLGLFESFDRGESWRLVRGVAASADIWNVQFHPNLPLVFIGTSAGTFVYEYEKFSEGDVVVTQTDDGFKLWNVLNEKLNVTVVEKESFAFEKEHLLPYEQKTVFKSFSDYMSFKKLMVWDSFENMMPYAPYYSLNN